MYTLYSIAAILSVFIGGLLIDRIGTRRASLLFSALVTIGAFIVAIAPNIWVLYFGRFIFGWGSESLVVAQSAIFTRWFKGKELAFAFGIGLTISRLGTLFSFNTEALIAEYFGTYSAALWAAVIFCCSRRCLRMLCIYFWIIAVNECSNFRKIQAVNRRNCRHAVRPCSSPPRHFLCFALGLEEHDNVSFPDWADRVAGNYAPLVVAIKDPAFDLHRFPVHTGGTDDLDDFSGRCVVCHDRTLRL